MKKTLRCKALPFLLALCLLLGASPAAAAQGPSPNRAKMAREPQNTAALLPPGSYVPHQLLVKLADGRGRSALPIAVENSQALFSIAVLPPDGVATFAAPQRATWSLLNLPEGTDLLDAMAELRTDKRVLAVELNRIVTATAAPLPVAGAKEPFENQQDWLTQMNAYAGWALFEARFPGKLPGEGITVAVLDSGIDADHPDLKDRIASGGTHFYLDDLGNVASDDQVIDERGHGTHVSGIIGAKRNSTGIVGVAHGASILPVRVLNAEGLGDTASTIAGIVYATSLPEVNVLNMSLGGYGGLSSQDAITLAQQAGKLVIVGAGNGSLPTVPVGNDFASSTFDPANCRGAITVMAEGDEPKPNGDWLTDFSNWDSNPGTGTEYHLMAPGETVLSDAIGGYAYEDGTSMASPTAAGAAAVLLSAGMSYDQVWDALCTSGPVLQGKTAPNGTVFSYHSLDLAAALGATPATVALKTELSVAWPETVELEENGFMPLTYMEDERTLLFANGKLQSKLSVTVESLHGTAENIIVSGDGIADSTPITLTPGQQQSIPLTITDADALDTLSVTYNGGADQQTLDAKLASVTAAPLPPITADTVLDASTLWCLTQSQTIEHSLTLAEGATLYFAEGAALTVRNNGAFTASGSADKPSVLMGNGQVAVEGGSTFSQCKIYNPALTQATRLDHCFLMSQGESPVCAISAGSIQNCQINGLPAGSTVTATGAFSGNLVDNNVGMTLTANQIFNNTFVENHAYPQNTADFKALRVVTPDCDEPATVGFYDNSVVGPMSVTTDAAGETPAVIRNVYYQPITDAQTIAHDFALPEGVVDQITCAPASSLLSENSPAEEIGAVTALCPPFLRKMDASYDWDADASRNQTGWVGANYTAHLSAPVGTAHDPAVCSTLGDAIFGTFVPTQSGSFAADGSAYTYYMRYPSANYDDYDTLQIWDFASKSNALQRTAQQSTHRWPLNTKYESLPLTAACEGNNARLNWTLKDGWWEENFLLYIVRNEEIVYECHYADCPEKPTTWLDEGVGALEAMDYTVVIYDTVNEYNIIQSESVGLTFLKPPAFSVPAALSLSGTSSATLDITQKNLLQIKSMAFDLVYNSNLLELTDVSDRGRYANKTPYSAQQTAPGMVHVSLGPLSSALSLGGNETLFTLTLQGKNHPGSGTLSLENVTVDGVSVETGISCAITITSPYSGSGDTPSHKPAVTVDGKGGTVKTDNATVTITPDEGYRTRKITVNGKEVDLPENGKLTGLKASDKVVVTFEKIPTVDMDQFTDLDKDAWYYTAAKYAVENGLFNGISDAVFGPGSDMTRAMLVTVLARLDGKDTAAAEGNEWYDAGMSWAVEQGISDGKNPGGSITREQLATMLYRYAGSPPPPNLALDFTDADRLSDYADNAMRWAVEKGLITGKGNRILAPKGNATRAEVAAILMRFMAL